MAKLFYTLEIEVIDEFADSFDGIDCSGIERYIENCYPEIQYADIDESSASNAEGGQ